MMSGHPSTISADRYFKQPKTYTREDWGARPAKRKVLMRTPVIYLVFKKIDTENCFTKEHCAQIIKDLQDDDMDRKGLPDIQYNFLIGSDGSIFEGRGWYTAPEPFPRNKYQILHQLNIRACFIGMLGENEEVRDTVEQEFAVIHLIGDGVEKKTIHENSQYMMWEEIGYQRSSPYDDDPA
ncbi:peptidoglycan-recognition protein 3-like [Macrosteles quadrilineatus]|uniref:peptidoglycan-recognition protein 3-like n=1 Tax=Macrosteles quadrilineatus TaxID=74068 RepID=UPI0023E10918|nr:peptidoglycan-recognition protein 3-like [Macrosteles quadrilineatus]